MANLYKKKNTFCWLHIEVKLSMMKKALGLVSGGLDSLIAISLIKEQNFDVIGVFILTPFISKFGEETIEILKKQSSELNFKLCVVPIDIDYIEIIKNPVFGYGKNLNPCIDCHIYMLKKAKEIMEKENASFVFTGEILGQRGKSQTLQALKIIEEKSSLKGKLLRPLTALNLPETEIEKNGIVDRNKLLGIKGKERKMQLTLAEIKNLKFFSSPAGGCLLTDSQFCKRLSDIFKYNVDAEINDYYLLQVGHHFRISPETKLVISRNRKESGKILELFSNKDIIILSSDVNKDIIGIIIGGFSEICLKIFASYISKSPVSIIIEEKGKKEEKIVQPEEKFLYKAYLI